MLTKEESLMVMARNLEATQQIDGVVHVVDENVKATKMLTEDIDDNMKATKVLVEDIDDNVKEIQGVARNIDSGKQTFLSVFAHLLTFYLVST
jgi:methyl-accepting chemotaxis protein